MNFQSYQISSSLPYRPSVPVGKCENKSIPTAPPIVQHPAKRVDNLITFFKRFGHPNFSVDDLGRAMHKQGDNTLAFRIVDNNRWYHYELTQVPNGLKPKEIYQHHDFNSYLKTLVIDVSLDDIDHTLEAHRLFGCENEEMARDFALVASMHADMMASVSDEPDVSGSQVAGPYLMDNAEAQQLLEEVFPQQDATGQQKFIDYTIRCANLSSECEGDEELCAQYKESLSILTNFYVALQEMHC